MDEGASALFQRKVQPHTSISVLTSFNKLLHTSGTLMRLGGLSVLDPITESYQCVIFPALCESVGRQSAR